MSETEDTSGTCLSHFLCVARVAGTSRPCAEERGPFHISDPHQNNSCNRSFKAPHFHTSFHEEAVWKVCETTISFILPRRKSWCKLYARAPSAALVESRQSCHPGTMWLLWRIWSVNHLFLCEYFFNLQCNVIIYYNVLHCRLKKHVW